MGIVNTLSKLKFFIFLTRIGNLLINSLYGATETFTSWFEMAFKSCMLEVTFHVNGLDLTYANIWKTSFTDVYIKQWLRRFPKGRFVCKYHRELACDWIILIAFGLATMHSLWHVIDGGAPPPAAAVSLKNVTKIYCEVNKNNEVESRVTQKKLIHYK